MEQVVDGGEADVLVAAAVTDDVVLGKQLVVVGGRDTEFIHPDGIAGDVIGIGGTRNHRRPGVAVVVDHARCGGVRDVHQEGMPGREGEARRHRRCCIAFDQAGCRDELRQAIRTWDEIAVQVCGQQGDTRHVTVGQLDAENVASLSLDVRPRRRAAVLAFQQSARGDWLAVA